MSQLITPARATEIIAERLEPLPGEILYFLEATGRILREPLFADREFPPYDRVMMDGIACRSADLPGPLTIAGLHAAGEPLPDALPDGHCWKIMTGAILPDDCDTIIPIEDVLVESESARLRDGCSATPGDYIHRRGRDCAKGTRLVPAGVRLGAPQIGVAATVGATKLPVSTWPRVVILSTGDEVIRPEAKPETHQVRQSNGATLFSSLMQYGIPEQNLRDFHLHDHYQQTLVGLSDIFGGRVPEPSGEADEGVDLLIITGGISKGEKDFIRPALEELIGPPAFHGVAQRPGKPLAFWHGGEGHPPVFALPGNPNSTLTTFHRYVRPALDILVGATPPPPLTLPLAEPFTPHPSLAFLLPGCLDESGRLVLHQPRNSGDIPATLNASGFAEIPPGTEAVTSARFRFC